MLRIKRMKLLLKRTTKFPTCIIGELYLDGLLQCYTLEDLERPVKVAGQTCIPLGLYQVVLDHSDHIGKITPHLLEVPGFSGIRIHSGNTDKDTEGCILVGQSKHQGYIEGSKAAFEALLKKLSLSTAPITIQIVDAF